MRTWKKEEYEPPDDLRITSLASTVEKIMQEEEGIPVVRVANHQQGIQKQRIKPTKPSKEGTRPYVDIQCSFCKTYGHKKLNCDKMSLWLTLQDNSHQIDEKMRSKLLDNYAKVTSERRHRQLQKLKGTVRQLYTEGDMDQADALWDQCIGNTMAEDTDDDASTSSDE
jgi:hypothetical protein